jgi:hypothetical protein
VLPLRIHDDRVAEGAPRGDCDGEDEQPDEGTAHPRARQEEFGETLGRDSAPFRPTTGAGGPHLRDEQIAAERPVSAHIVTAADQPNVKQKSSTPG